MTTLSLIFLIIWFMSPIIAYILDKFTDKFTDKRKN